MDVYTYAENEQKKKQEKLRSVHRGLSIYEGGGTRKQAFGWYTVTSSKNGLLYTILYETRKRQYEILHAERIDRAAHGGQFKRDEKEW